MRQVRRLTNNRLAPYYPNPAQHMRALRFLPNITIVAGQVLGEITAASQSAVQTLTFGGTVSGGTFTVTLANIDGGNSTTAALAYNIANTALETALETLFAAAGYPGVIIAVTNGPAPANTTLTFGGTLANFPVPLMTATSSLTGSSPTLTIANTTVGKTKGFWGAYNDAGSDGLQTAKALSEYDFRTDNEGYCVFGNSTATTQFGAHSLTAPAFFNGRFKCSDLTGLDANGIADLGRLESGASYSDVDAILAIY